MHELRNSNTINSASEISIHHYNHSDFGWMTGFVVARGREAAREMARGFLDFAKSALLGQTWGESVFFEPLADGGYRDVQKNCVLNLLRSSFCHLSM